MSRETFLFQLMRIGSANKTRPRDSDLSQRVSANLSLRRHHYSILGLKSSARSWEVVLLSRRALSLLQRQPAVKLKNFRAFCRRAPADELPSVFVRMRVPVCVGSAGLPVRL